MQFKRGTQGVSIVEIVIGASIMGLLVIASVSALALFVRSATDSKEQIIALYLAEAGVEYMKHIRSVNWDNISSLSTDTTYYFAVSTTTLATSTSPEVIDGYYERSLHLTDLYRDNTGDIVSSTTPGATIDTEAFYLTVEVGYGSSSVALSSIMTNINDE